MIRNLLVVVTFLSLGGPAWAQCTRDTDCKGERICVQGVCAEPGPINASLVGPARPAPAARAVRTGWATGAGSLGIATGALVLGLSVGSEIYRDEQMPGLPLGIAATVLLAAMGPVVASGGASARSDEAVSGLLGLRIGGWVAYGLTLANAVALIGMSVAEYTPPRGQIAATGALGLASLVLFSVDAFVSGAQARSLARQSLAEADRVRWGLSVAPLWREAKVDGGVVGVGGTF